MSDADPFSAAAPRIAALEKGLAWFVGLALAILVLLGFLVAVKHDVFAQVTRLHFSAASAAGISRDMAVKLLGFKVGKVEDIQIEQTGQVRVTLKVKNAYMHLVPQDSRVRLMKEGLIGDNVVEIIPGSKDARQAANDALLTFERDRSLAEMAGELTAEVKPLLGELRKTAAGINDPQGDVRQTLRNVTAVSANLAQTSDRVRSLTEKADRRFDALQGKLSTTLEAAAGSARHLNHTLQVVDERLPALLDKTDATLENVRTVTAAAAAEVPPVLRDGRQAAGDAKEIVSGAKRAWPIRNFVAPQENLPLPMDSYVPAQ
jgi:phospholipid/cholesterol/gamma-HCH transport system substrate-binding protein